MTVQTALHALFLPTPLKRALAQLSAATDPDAGDRPAKSPSLIETEATTEVLKPGALYRECSVVTLDVPALPEPPADEKSKEHEQKGKDEQGRIAEFDLEDDGEYGGEGVGRVVWEWYETRLKTWEAQFKDTETDKPEAAADAKKTQ